MLGCWLLRGGPWWWNRSTHPSIHPSIHPSGSEKKRVRRNRKIRVRSSCIISNGSKKKKKKVIWHERARSRRSLFFALSVNKQDAEKWGPRSFLVALLVIQILFFVVVVSHLFQRLDKQIFFLLFFFLLALSFVCNINNTKKKGDDLNLCWIGISFFIYSPTRGWRFIDWIKKTKS